MAKIVTLFGRQDLSKLQLDGIRFLLRRESQPITDADAVGIGNDSRLMEHIAHDEVCGLSADAR